MKRPNANMSRCVWCFEVMHIWAKVQIVRDGDGVQFGLSGAPGVWYNNLCQILILNLTQFPGILGGYCKFSKKK